MLIIIISRFCRNQLRTIPHSETFSVTEVAALIIVFNDLPKCRNHSKSILYADDMHTPMLYSAKISDSTSN